MRKRMSYVDECKLLGIPIDEDQVSIVEEPEVKHKKILEQVLKPKKKGK